MWTGIGLQLPFLLDRGSGTRSQSELLREVIYDSYLDYFPDVLMTVFVL